MIRNDRELKEYLDGIAEGSEFLRRTTYVHTLALKVLRGLTPKEVDRLEAQGNICGDWNSIFVPGDFEPELIHNNVFSGTCAFAGFPETGEKKLSPGKDARFLRGIYNSFLSNVFIYPDVSVIASTINGVRSTDLPESGDSCRFFGTGVEISPGLETGGRPLRLFPDISYDFARYVLSRPGDGGAGDKFIPGEELPLFTSIICEGTIVHRCGELSRSYIGPYTVISGASEITNVSVVSTIKNPVTLGTGIVVRDSTVKEGTIIDSGAYVEKSCVLECSTIEKHAKVAESVVGPETGIAEGEVSASFAGPFIGFHHQALLISAFWPDGKGNVAHGANIGSNHTSRLPDQEIWPGEGMFFGLGCSVKFPADFHRAPYSIIAAGVVTLPQKMEFPFSLIAQPEKIEPEMPPAYNRLFPGWCLYANMYMCVRAERKYLERAKFLRDCEFLAVFRRDVMEKVWDALILAEKLLDRATRERREIVQPGDCGEIGKNYAYVADLRAGVEAYRRILRYYCLSDLVRTLRSRKITYTAATSADMMDRFTARLFEGLVFPEFAREGGNPPPASVLHEKYLDILKSFEIDVLKCLQKDLIRGKKIIPDYAATHPEPDRDPVFRWFLEKNSERIRAAEEVFKAES